MHQIKTRARQVKETAAQYKQQAAEVAAHSARIGYTTKGIFYLIIGGLSLQAASEADKTNLSIHRVLVQILTQPFGQVLLGLMVLGMAAYVLWRLAQTFLDPDGKGTDPSGLIQRAGYFFSGVSYAVVSYSALELIIGKSTREATIEIEEVINFILFMPFGRVLIGILGIVFLGVSFFQLHRAISANFSRHIDWSQVSRIAKHLILLMGRIGYAARGVLYLIIAISFGYAAVVFDPNTAGGIGFAIRFLDQWNSATWALEVIAVGLLIFGLYNIAFANFRVSPFEELASAGENQG